MRILKELSTMITCRKTRDHEFIEASNRFYTMIPHTFGVHRASPVLDTADKIAKEMEILGMVNSNVLTNSKVFRIVHYYGMGKKFHYVLIEKHFMPIMIHILFVYFIKFYSSRLTNYVGILSKGLSRKCSKWNVNGCFYN